MLTKQDLEAITRIVRSEGKEIREEAKNLEERLEDKIGDLYDSVFTLRADNSEDHMGIKRRLTEFREIFNKYRKVFDEYLQKTRKEVARIENYLKLPPLS